MDALLLARIQFGFVISFHVLFPAFTIGLSSWLAFLEFRWLRTRDPVWRDLYFFWLKIFAVSFGMGVVSGIVMSFQFGTNWSVLSERGGNILGPLLSYEVLTAFFLEASFLGVMLFGWTRVPPKVHFFATCMVALGTLISTFWILSANSFLQTPAGYAVVDGVLEPASWMAIVFNPSFPYRLVHMVLAAFITTCFTVGGVSGWYLRKGRHVDMALRMLKLAIVFAAITVPLQIMAGDAHGLNTLEHQPMKVAAMEGHYRANAPGEGLPLVLFGIPNDAEERMDHAIEIPRAGGLILTHSLDGTIPPLQTVPAADRPPVAPIFFAFRIMVGLGFAMLGLVAWSLLTWARRRLDRAPWLYRAWNAMLPAGFIAIVAGWYVTEIGRQPWVVYGVLRTADAVSHVSATMVAVSLATYVAGYALVFGAGGWYLLKMLRAGPQPHEEAPDIDDVGDGATTPTRTPARPLSAADKPLEGE